MYDSLHAYSGNISADVFRNQVAVVLDVWERWSVDLRPHRAWWLTGRMAVSQDVQDLMRDYLSGARAPGQSIKAKPDQVASAEEAQVSRKDKGDDDAPMSGFKKSGFKSSFKPAVVEAPVAVKAENLDGKTMDGEEDLDGEVMDEDLDGEAMDDDLDGEAF